MLLRRHWRDLVLGWHASVASISSWTLIVAAALRSRWALESSSLDWIEAGVGGGRSKIWRLTCVELLSRRSTLTLVSASAASTNETSAWAERSSTSRCEWATASWIVHRRIWLCWSRLWRLLSGRRLRLPTCDDLDVVAALCNWSDWLFSSDRLRLLDWCGRWVFALILIILEVSAVAFRWETTRSWETTATWSSVHARVHPHSWRTSRGTASSSATHHA